MEGQIRQEENFGMRFGMKVGSHWKFECYSHHHKDGSKCVSPWMDEKTGEPCCSLGIPLEEHEHRLKWKDTIENLVVTAGRDKLLDAVFKTGYTTPDPHVGLKDTGTVDPADTMASHAGWVTLTVYSNGTDPAFAPGTISGGAVSNSASKAVFNINAPDDVYGAFLKLDDDTKGGATGILYGAGNFTGGTRAVQSGDTLNVQIDLSITAS